MAEDSIVDISHAIQAELDAISRSRESRGVPKCASNPDPRQRAHASQLLGLAFSGGGIRSATFNLGILQALAELGILNRVDYLSTVSGGGYIGSWLVTWIKRGGLQHTLRGLTRSVRTQPVDDVDPIFALRRYSNYLAPKLGFFGADTWTIGAIYIRNLLLNQLILVAVLGAVLMIPRLLNDVVVALQQRGTAMVILAAGLLAWATSVISFDLRALITARRSTEPAQARIRWLQTSTGVQAAVVFPILAGAFLLSVCGNFVNSAAAPYVFSTVFTLILLSTGTQSGWDLFFRSGERLLRGAVLLGIASGLPGIAIGILTALVSDRVNRMDTWHLLVWGTPIFVGLFSLAAILHLGLLGSRLPDEAREWWSRLGALLSIYSLGWTALAAVAIYGPLILTLGVWAAAMGVVWLITSGLGAAAARNPTTGAGVPSLKLEIFAKVAPYVFIVGLLMLIATGLQVLLAPQVGIFQGLLQWPLPPMGDVAAKHWRALDVPDLSLSISMIVLLLEIALIFSLTLDVNEFSMHQFYRNRLVRAYLGASRNRQPEPFTGFDPHDDMPLSHLAQSDYTGPFPIINTALNLVQGEELAGQERKAASFFFTPLFSGFEFPERLRRSVPGPVPLAAFRPTSDYAYPARGGIEIGTAMGISGAAASPNMGYHTSAAASFLMTMFNVRLGWWLGNPARGEAYRNAAPPVALYYLFKELLGKTDSYSWYVYLSDGGHFENLGVYELVRRRCRCIIACDAAQDDKYGCDDLANAIRKCRTDLGISIDIDVSNIRDIASGRSKWHCAVGRIRYEQADHSATPGTFIYLKASLTGDETVDVLSYAARNCTFPHQTTADQFFTESQFESYRSLGYHIARETFTVAARENPNASAFEEFLIALRERWYPASAATAVAFSRHAAQLEMLHDQLRKEPELAFLDAQIYPEWPALMNHADKQPVTEMWLPPDAAQLRAGFFFCNSLIQLMESVYLDLNLETDADHPDNRGWINLFKHWSWSGMFRSTWAISASTFGARFQTWCGRQLDLTLGDIVARPCDPTDLNFHEQAVLAYLLDANPRLTDHTLYALENCVEDVATGGDMLRLPFGFVIVQSNMIYLLRVQDHLRRMGLAHAAVRAVVAQQVANAWDRSAMIAAGEFVDAERIDTLAAREIRAMREPASLNSFQRIFDSVARGAGIQTA